MFSKTASYIWSLRHQFTKYFIVGISGLVLDLGSLILFKQVFKIPATVAVIMNQPIVLAYNFVLNKYWSFKNKEMPHKQIVRYLSLAAANYLFSVGAMYLLHDIIGLDYRIVRLITVAMMVPINFFLYKYWVYSEKAGEKTIDSVSDIS